MKFNFISVAVAATVVSIFPVAAALAAPIEELAPAQETWRGAMTKIPPPAEGCFSAVYPSTRWEQVACGEEPVYHSTPIRAIHKFAMHLAGRDEEQTAGNGYDYIAETSGLTKSAVGSFPQVSGVTSEQSVGVPEYGNGGILGSNDYSVQLNTEIDVNSPPGCTKYHNIACGTWQQFVYATNYSQNGSAAGFMQYWLFFSGQVRCPSGFGNAGYSEGVQSCYKNSTAVTIPDEAASALASLKLSGAAVANGTDTFTVTVGTKAYTTTGKDSVVEIATTWNQSEFNIVGDAGGSEAEFNSGASITVNLEVSSGTTSAPMCLGPSNEGTTGESNNLNLGSCSVTGGSAPAIQFVESD